MSILKFLLGLDQEREGTKTIIMHDAIIVYEQLKIASTKIESKLMRINKILDILCQNQLNLQSKAIVVHRLIFENVLKREMN